MALERWVERVMRPGQPAAAEVRRDVLWLLGFGILLMGVGLGMRDPWPADEPRFALIAWDMVRNGQWLIPMVGGDTYADKPPLFFWLIALAVKLTGSLRWAFLLPSLLASLGTVLLVYDLSRRLWNREAGFTAALLLLVTVQFVWQGRQAQIDATLCFWTTLGLYGLLRHLLLGPSWNWYAIGWAAAGFGVITKGVGFLPVLVLLPYALLRGEWQPRPKIDGGWRWLWGPAAFVCAVAVWLAPMLLAATRIPALAAYRDEILFHQTMGRYSNAWHHVEPFWYFIVEVIPPLWLPMSALLPWMVPRWRATWSARDLRIALPLSWIVLVVIFFSASTGKRGVYILPALPALAITMAPYLRDLLSKAGPRRIFWALAWVVIFISVAAGVYLLAMPARRMELIARYGVDGVGPLLTIGLAGVAACALTRVRFAAVAYGAVIAATLMVVGLWIAPSMNDVRSSERFVRRVEDLAQGFPELGLVLYKEQFLLEFTRPTVNFGHARWREEEAEAYDAAAWLAAGKRRALLMAESIRRRCFATAEAIPVENEDEGGWYVVSGAADSECVARGKLLAAHRYSPAQR